MTRYPEGPGASPGFLLWHATLRWQRAITAVLQPLDLTHVQFVLLGCAWWLQEHDSTPNQLELARQAGTDVKMTSQVVRKLEDKGLLRREIDVADNRAKRIRVTPKGIRLATRAINVVEDVDARFFGASADDAVPMLRRLADVPAGDAG